MRLCFISRRFFPTISGMSVYALNLLRELVAAGHDVTMVSQYRGDAFGKRVYGGGPPPPVPGVRVIGLEQVGEQDGGDFERDVEAMREAVVAEHRRRPLDVIHAQYGYPCGWAALLASRDTGVPNVVSIQGGDGHWVGSCCETHRLAMVRVLDHANRVLIGCRSFAEEVTGRLGTAPSRFTIVPGAVDTARFTPGTAPDPAAAPVLLYHGRVDARKGVLDLLDAARQLRDEGERFRLLVSGIGPTFDETEEAIRALGLGDHVEMTGYVDYEQVPEVYRRAEIFVSPTYAEGFSNTILEAMASGLAVVSCRAVGVVDCIRDGENGLLTEPGDRVGLANALRRLLRDRVLRRRLADAALAECRAVYSWGAVGRQIMGIYASVRGEAPDLGWAETLPLEPCRFRAEPHLL
ncbi:MAG: glycosyltransferase family 4 protein [Acetobacteraceae bacterium]|nr:glycosyltransferase family 4 protein [Acetobacteraceae bacterium]